MMSVLVERVNLRRSLRKIDILLTVQKYHQLTRTRAVSYSRIDIGEGMELVEVLARQGSLRENCERWEWRGLRGYAFRKWRDDFAEVS